MSGGAIASIVCVNRTQGSCCCWGRPHPKYACIIATWLYTTSRPRPKQTAVIAQRLASPGCSPHIPWLQPLCQHTSTGSTFTSLSPTSQKNPADAMAALISADHWEAGNSRLQEAGAQEARQQNPSYCKGRHPSCESRADAAKPWVKEPACAEKPASSYIRPSPAACTPLLFYMDRQKAVCRRVTADALQTNHLRKPSMHLQLGYTTDAMPLLT